MFSFLKKTASSDPPTAAGGSLSRLMQPDAPSQPEPPCEERSRAHGPRVGGRQEKDGIFGKDARKLNLVRGKQLLRSIDEAVRTSVEEHLPGADPSRLAAIVHSARTRLFALLKQGSQSVRGLSKADFLKEAEADRRRIVAESEKARRELEHLLVQLRERRAQVGRIQDDLVAESRKSGLLQDEQLTQRIHAMFGGDEADAETARIRDRILELVLHTVQTEREKVVDAQMTEHKREVDRFERRISKLTASLELTEEELHRIARMKDVDLGVASIYRDVQGLSLAEAAYEAKLEMMRCIFEANLELQKGDVSSD